MAKVPQLSDYALIGNCRSAALVSKYGAIEWCCLPEFHSPALFSALLDKKRGGQFSINPVGDYDSFQQYIRDTNVVETRFTAKSGKAILTDAFVAQTEAEKTLALFPDHEILRVVKVISGTIRFRMEFAPTIFYGRFAPSLADHKKLGIHFSHKENTYVLCSTMGEINVSDGKAFAEFELVEGEGVIFSFSCSSQSPAIFPELHITGWQRMEQTIAFWKTWIARCNYDGLYKEWVRRSALTLKLLAHAPSGAIVAAPTTSLPEELEGERNWDYRYCWLRDASFTIRALIKLGFEEEAHAYMHWILHATRLTWPRLQVVYSVYGLARLKEQRLDWLRGYRNSGPVRVGNGAHNQFQLDVYGEVLDAVYSYSKLIKQFDPSSRKFILGLGEVITKLWNQPDNGIWEVRSKLCHHTHSKVMAWVGLDRLIRLAKKFKWKDVPLEQYEHVKRSLEKQVEDHGYNSEVGSYTREFGGRALDASTLVFSLVGYCEACSPRMLSTTQRIGQHLSKSGLIYRYLGVNDGISGGEGAFGLCTFWLVENLAKSGRLQDGITVFETMLKHASPTGLFSEQIDPASFELLGNYPQGFTHIGLINAALTINEAYLKGVI